MNLVDRMDQLHSTCLTWCHGI